MGKCFLKNGDVFAADDLVGKVRVKIVDALVAGSCIKKDCTPMTVVPHGCKDHSFSARNGFGDDVWFGILLGGDEIKFFFEGKVFLVDVEHGINKVGVFPSCRTTSGEIFRGETDGIGLERPRNESTLGFGRCESGRGRKRER